MKYSIFVILGITATLLVFSLMLFFKAKKKEKAFGVYFIIPICIGLMTITGMSLGLSSKLEYDKLIKEKNQEIVCFLNDYTYYCEIWASIVDYCESNEIDFSQSYDIEPTLEQNKLSKKVLQYDTFYTYFSRYYVKSANSFGSYYGDCCIILESINSYYYDERASIPFGIYKFSGSGNSYVEPSFTQETRLNEERFKLIQITESDNLENIISDLTFYSDNGYNYGTSPFTITEYIIMIVYTSLIVLFNLISMIYFFARHKDLVQGDNTINNSAIKVISNDNKILEEHSDINKETPPPPPKPKWEELKEEEKKSYIDNAIKQLYENQLKNTNLELTRQQRAIKKDCLENKEFYLEDLTEEEKASVEQTAKSDYDNGISLTKTQVIDIPQESNKSIVKKGFKWFIYNSMITTRERQLNTKTTTLKANGYGGLKLEEKDNSNKASLIRPCGKCMSVSGEKPLDFVVGFNPFKKIFYCCGVFKGFSFVGEDILQYKMLSSNSKSEKYELIHKTGKKIVVSFNPIGSELLNAVLGADKFID